MRRHLPHGLAEGTLALAAALLNLTTEWRGALMLAALAGFLASALVIETDYQSRRRHRAAARSIVASAARRLLALVLSQPEPIGPLSITRRVVTLEGVGRRERIDLSGGSLRGTLNGLAGRLDEARGRFAATIGTQMTFLEPREQQLAIRALTGLDAAIVTATDGSDAAWRSEVLGSCGIRGEAIALFDGAHVRPAIDSLHSALVGVAAAAGELGIGAGSDLPTVPSARPAAGQAASAVGRTLIDDAIVRGVSIGGWWAHSSLRDQPAITMHTLADQDDLTFDDDARSEGWSSLNDMLRQEAQFASDSLEMVEDDLPAESAEALRAFAKELDAARRAAYEAGEAGRHAADVRVKQLPVSELTAARDAFTGERQRFLERMRAVVAAAKRADELF